MLDLHCHSLFSDGTDTPEALAIRADALGLVALALTDHDTLEGLPRFLAMQATTRTRLLPGIELSCRFMGRELHVLGLMFNPQDKTFQSRIQEVRNRRHQRNDALVARLQALGISIRLEDVQACAPTDLVSRTHFAKVLAALRVVPTAQEAHRKLIGEGGQAFVPFQELAPTEAAQWIHEAGGLAIVAHPGRFARGRFIWDQAMADLRDMGMDGLEAYYSEYSPTEQRRFIQLANQLGMVACGGSDYHGAMKPGLEMGRGRGHLCVPDAVLLELENCRGRFTEGSPSQGV